MGNLFSKKPPPPKGPSVSSQDKALLKLKVQRDKLTQYQVRLEKVIDDLKKKAAKFIELKQKDRALLCLKQKKFQESLLIKADTNLANLEQMVFQVEDSAIQAQVLERISEGNSLLREIEKEMSVEKVELIMDESREHYEHYQEIGQILGESLTADDLNDVENEYLLLMDEEATKLQLELNNTPVPVSKQPSIEKPSEEEDQEEDEPGAVKQERKAVLA
ncbi:hypothetical protein P9112_008815 [Eukaryota sp. TZLM1-RC]